MRRTRVRSRCWLLLMALLIGAGALPAQAGALPTGWSSVDIGTPGAAGSSDYDVNGRYTVNGAGADVWDTADAFHFVYRTLTGDGEIVARVDSLQGVHQWTKAGVMMRESLEAGSRHAYMLVSSAKGLAYQRRVLTGGLSDHTDGGAGAAPQYVRLTRSGNTFSAYRSPDGVAWTLVGSQSLSMASTVYVGLAVTSHESGVIAAASFSSVEVGSGDTTAQSGSGDEPLPSGWSDRDVGSVGAAGFASYSGGRYTIGGAGADIWGTADGFHFAYRTLTGDGEIVARVESLQEVHQWTKAGVMMRESLSAGARHAHMLVSPARGLAFQRRASTAASTVHTDGGAGAAPQYVRLSRSGSTFEAYRSPDGVSWTLVGSQSMSMPPTIYVGLAVTSHEFATRATATFTGVNVGTSAPPPPSSGGDAALPDGWSTRDIGSVAAAGSASYAGGRYTVAGSGRDIWDTADEFRFVYRTLSGDGEIVARVESLQRLHDWTKAGVMMRESLDAGSRHAFMLVSSGKGVAFQRRASTGGLSLHTSGGAGTAPAWVRLARSGTTFYAYRSPDGSNWTLVGSQSIPMASTIYVGLALTSKVDGALAAATFTDVAVQTGTLAGPPPGSPTTNQIRVLHWNIHHGVGTDGDYDVERLAAWMASMQPDVISLNEVEKFTGWGDEDQPARIAALLTEKTGETWHYHFAQRYGSWSSNGQGNLVLSRFPLTHTARLKLTCSRSAALAGLLVNGRPLNFVSTHLDNESSSCRSAQAAELLAWFATFSEDRIAAGDWNAQAPEAPVKAVTQTYNDAWARAVAKGTATDYAGNSEFGATRTTRIDYVFYSKTAAMLELVSAQIYDTRDASGDMPSDHKPLVVTFEIR